MDPPQAVGQHSLSPSQAISEPHAASQMSTGSVGGQEPLPFARSLRVDATATKASTRNEKTYLNY